MKRTCKEVEELAGSPELGGRRANRGDEVGVTGSGARCTEPEITTEQSEAGALGMSHQNCKAKGRRTMETREHACFTQK
jgi:hypothetical protein